MAEVIRMPRMSDTMEEGNIVNWLKEEGDTVEPGDTLAEVETDKATMELDSYDEGVLLHIAVKQGTVPIDGIIAVIGEEGEDWKAAIEKAKKEHGDGNGESSGDEKKDTSEKEESQEDKGEKEKAASDDETQKQVAAEEKESDKEAASSESGSGNGRIKASPLAKSMAKDEGVDIANIKGSGDQGRIIKRDVEAYLEAKAAAPKPAQAPQEKTAPQVKPFAFTAEGDNYEDVPVSQMRKTIARRLGESKFTAPHFYLTVEVNMDKAVALRQQLNEVAPVKISFNDLIIKACARALRQHPAVNASWHGDTIRIHKEIHIGVAVAVDEGLLVPVIRYADMKTMSQINSEVRVLADKARTKKLQLEEMQGNTFTISNLGMFGIEEFTAIINPPDACILAVGGIMQKPIVKDGEIVPGNMMKVTLSCDHRVVDGATGAQFLKTLHSILEDPIRLLV